MAEGFRFITHKAGGDRDDPEIGAWWNGVQGLGRDVLLGAYWVQYPGSPTGRADAFLARLDSQCPGWRARDAFLLQVDCEKWNGDPATMPGRTDIKAFCARLVARTGGKYRPVVYAPKWAYGDTLTGLGFPLWASSYVSGSGAASALYPGDTSARWAAYSGQTPAILQFTSSATIAGQSTCDANAFRGTLAQLKELVTPPPVITPPQEGPDVNLDDKIGDPAHPNRTVRDLFRDLAHKRGWEIGDLEDSQQTPPVSGSPAALMLAAAAEVKALRAETASMGVALGEAIRALGAQNVDLDALADKLADAVVAKLPADRDDITADELAEAIRLAVGAQQR